MKSSKIIFSLCAIGSLLSSSGFAEIGGGGALPIGASSRAAPAVTPGSSYGPVYFGQTPGSAVGITGLAPTGSAPYIPSHMPYEEAAYDRDAMVPEGGISIGGKGGLNINGGAIGIGGPRGLNLNFVSKDPSGTSYYRDSATGTMFAQGQDGSIFFQDPLGQWRLFTAAGTNAPAGGGSGKGDLPVPAQFSASRNYNPLMESPVLGPYGGAGDASFNRGVAAGQGANFYAAPAFGDRRLAFLGLDSQGNSRYKTPGGQDLLVTPNGQPFVLELDGSWSPVVSQ